MIFVEIFWENLVFDHDRGIFPLKNRLFLASLAKFPELNSGSKNSPGIPTGFTKHVQDGSEFKRQPQGKIKGGCLLNSEPPCIIFISFF